MAKNAWRPRRRPIGLSAAITPAGSATRTSRSARGTTSVTSP
ncbi:hypothetical protein [Spirillospora sp. NPDC047279]